MSIISPITNATFSSFRPLWIPWRQRKCSTLQTRTGMESRRFEYFYWHYIFYSILFMSAGFLGTSFRLWSTHQHRLSRPPPTGRCWLGLCPMATWWVTGSRSPWWRRRRSRRSTSRRLIGDHILDNIPLQTGDAPRHHRAWLWGSETPGQMHNLSVKGEIGSPTVDDSF